MTILWINLAIVFSTAFFARYFAAPVFAGSLPVTVKPNKLLFLLTMASFVVISGLRSNIGDTYVYRNNYEQNEFTWEFIVAQKDIGFGILQGILKNYISDDPQILFITAALVTNVLILFVFYNYSRMIELSVYVYITGGLFLVSMNGVRQVLAAAIAFTAIKYLTEGNFLKYACIVVLASFFHQSALVLLPMYFLVRFKAWSKATIVLIIFAVLIVTSYELFSSLLFAALEDTQYGHYQSFSEGGANFLRVAVAGTPLFIAYLGRERLREIMPNSDYIVNMALIGVVFMIIATQNWIFARISIYFELYQLILISWIVKVFRDRDQKIVYLGIIACYLAYFYFENVMNLNIMYRSDYISL